MSVQKVELDGYALNDVDERIVLLSVSEASPQGQLMAYDYASGIGQHVAGRKRQFIDVTVKVAINQYSHDTDGQVERMRVLEQVTRWAMRAYRGAWLTLANRPGRRLWVHVNLLPGRGAAYDFGQEYTITFRASELPYWQSVSPEMRTYEKYAVREMDLTFDGSAPTPLCFSVINNGTSVLDEFRVTVGERFIAFRKAGVPVGGKLVLSYAGSRQGIAVYDSTEALIRDGLTLRTAESADDLWIDPVVGAHVRIEATQVCTWQLWTLARWA